MISAEEEELEQDPIMVALKFDGEEEYCITLLELSTAEGLREMRDLENGESLLHLSTRRGILIEEVFVQLCLIGNCTCRRFWRLLV